MENEFTREAESKMAKSLETFQEEIMHIRTGRASTGLVESLDVEAYGQKMKLNQLATINAPEPRLLTVQPWDKSQLDIIEKAIMASPLEVNPSNDGTIIRIPLPQMSEERRKEVVKLVGKLAEEARVAVRNIRRTEIDAIKKQQKDGDVPEDDAHKLTDTIQKITDKYTGKIDDALKAKEDEIMEV
jgi:ribosome recycling factor